MADIATTEDSQLLGNYARAKSDDAFRHIVERHGRWVFAAAYRQLRDRQMAEDATQVVFILLAKRADTMSNGSKLSGWLFATLQYTVKNMLRMQYRRQKYEREAAGKVPQNPSQPRENLSELALRLDAAVNRLSSADRSAILLRFYRDCSFQEIAATLGVTEPAARKRVARAVQALRRHLGPAPQVDPERLLATAAMGLAMAPANLTQYLTTVALAAKAGAALPTTITAATKGTAWLMTVTKIQAAATLTAASLLIAAPVTLAAIHYSSAAPAAQAQLAAAPESPPAADLSLPTAAAPAAASQPDEELAKFNRLYSLAPGENLKLVPPPGEGRLAGYKAMVAADAQRHQANEETLAKVRQEMMARLATQPSGVSFSIPPTNAAAGRRGGGGGTSATRTSQFVGRGPAMNPDGSIPEKPPQDAMPFALVIRYKEGKPLELEHEQRGNWPNNNQGLTMAQLLDLLLKLPQEALEDDAGLSNKMIPGDFVFRDGATPEQLRAGLEKIFGDVLKTPVSLQLKDVDEIVYVLKGKWAYKPVAGQDAGGMPNIHIYSQEMGPARGSGNGGTSDPNHYSLLLQPLTRLLKSTVIMDAQGVPADMSYTLHEVAGGAVDVKAVLDHVTEQTGLTWTEETQKAKHVVIELGPGA